MTGFRYRLEPLLEQKTEAREKAERDLAASRASLKQAMARLDELIAMEKRLSEERSALRRSLIGAEGSESIEVSRRVDDVAIFARRVESARDEVFAHRLVIEEREEDVERCKQAVAEATRDEEVLKKHKEKSAKRWAAERERKEAGEQEEIASTMHQIRRWQ